MCRAFKRKARHADIAKVCKRYCKDLIGWNLARSLLNELRREDLQCGGNVALTGVPVAQKKKLTRI